jgi:hypothetical protein
MFVKNMKSYGTITKLHFFQEFGQLCTSLLVFSVPVERLRRGEIIVRGQPSFPRLPKY